MKNVEQDDKAQRRSELLLERNSLSVSKQEELSMHIYRNLVPIISNAHSVGIYVPINSEVRTRLIHNYLLSMGIAPLYPAIRTRGRNKVMVFTRVDDPRNLNHYQYGFPQPRKFVTYPRNAIDVILVPGAGFDHKGNRIGYGKGYYDRYLSKFDGEIVGVGYDFQLTDILPTEQHDVRMHRVVTNGRRVEIMSDDYL